MRALTSGIYKVTNTVTNEIYIGASVNCEGRFRTHKSKLRKGTHTLGNLQRDCNIHCVSVYKFEIIEECDIDDLPIREQYYMDLLKPALNANHNATSMIGFKHRIEVKKACSKSVIQMDLEGNEIKEWYGAKIAADTLGYSFGSVSRACRGERKTYKGFTWKYK